MNENFGLGCHYGQPQKTVISVRCVEVRGHRVTLQHKNFLLRMNFQNNGHKFQNNDGYFQVHGCYFENNCRHVAIFLNMQYFQYRSNIISQFTVELLLTTVT